MNLVVQHDHRCRNCEKRFRKGDDMALVMIQKKGKTTKAYAFVHMRHLGERPNGVIAFTENHETCEKWRCREAHEIVIEIVPKCE